MNNTNEIKRLLKEHNGIITTAILNDHNIPRICLSRLVKNHTLVRMERGIYIDNTGHYDEDYFFQVRFRKCIFSFQSALYLHDLTERVPFQKEVTLYKGYNPHTLPRNITVHFVNKEIYELGIVTLKTKSGNLVRAYDKEKTICELVKNRETIDVEIFKKAIYSYLKLKDKDVNMLYQYARILGIEKEINEIVEMFYE